MQVEVTTGMDMKDFVDEVKSILKENDNIVIRTRAGLVVIDMDTAPEKVFVLVGEESYFYPADTIGEKFQVPLKSTGDKVVEVEVLSNSPRLVMIKSMMFPRRPSGPSSVFLGDATRNCKRGLPRGCAPHDDYLGDADSRYLLLPGRFFDRRGV